MSASPDPTLGGILSLDLSTKTGWAYGPAAWRLRRPQCYGTWDLGSSKVSLAIPWAALVDALGDALTLYRPSLVVMEAPLPAQAQKHERVARLLIGLCCMVELVCYRWGVECREQNAIQVRKSLLNNARPDKADIVAWCRARGLADLTDHNAADAVTLWFYAAALRS